jgi:hypothetical protein
VRKDQFSEGMGKGVAVSRTEEVSLEHTHTHTHTKHGVFKGPKSQFREKGRNR